MGFADSQFGMDNAMHGGALAHNQDSNGGDHEARWHETLWARVSGACKQSKTLDTGKSSGASTEPRRRPMPRCIGAAEPQMVCTAGLHYLGTCCVVCGAPPLMGVPHPPVPYLP